MKSKKPLAQLLGLFFILYNIPAEGAIPQGVFTNVRNITDQINPGIYFDFDAVVTEDQLTLFFTSEGCQTLPSDICVNRPGGDRHDMFVATRDSVDESFTDAEELISINTPALERLGSVSSDGLTIYYSSEIKGNYDFYVATRESLDDEFGVPMEIEELNTSWMENNPSLTEDGLELFYHTRPNRSFPREIRVASRTSVDEPFSPGQPVNGDGSWSTYDAAYPFILPDGLTLFFSDGMSAGDPPRPEGLGDGDIYVATRLSRDDAFGPAVNLHALWPGSTINTQGLDLMPSVSPTWPAPGSKLYFSYGEDAVTDFRLQIYQADWVPAVPEPSSITLSLGLALVCLLSRQFVFR
jgi:hypothetical protein